MTRILTMRAKEGMIVASNIYTSSDRLVILKGTELTEEILDKLKYYGIFDFYIEDAVLDDIKDLEDWESDTLIDNDPRTHRYYDRIRNTPEFGEFEKIFNHSAKAIKDNIDAIALNGSTVHFDILLDAVNSITDKFEPKASLFDMLKCIEGYDDLTYIHSLNVALIAKVLGKWIGLNDEEINILTLSGVLHDIGKVMIPHSIITKPGRLTAAEYAIVQAHPTYGFTMLMNSNTTIDKRIANGVLQHHERCDGSGYPSRLVSGEIDEFAKIIAISDVYDAMTANRVYRQGICPFSVIEEFEKKIDAYDPKILMVFLEKIAQSYVNENVWLSDNREGKIIMINKYALAEPCIVIDDEYIDLSRHRDIKIKSLL